MHKTAVQFLIICPKSGNHLKIPGAKFQVEERKILGPTVQNLVTLGP